MTNCRVPSDWSADFSGCLYDWQTLVGGGLALLAALLGALFLYFQIDQTAALNRADLVRRHNASRSVMPLGLAAISEFCASIVDQIAQAIELQDNPDFDLALQGHVDDYYKRMHFNPVKISDDVIAVIKEFIETLTDTSNVRHVAELLSKIQILQARFNGFNLHQIAAVESLYGLLLDSATVGLLNDRMFNYSRFVDDASFSLVGVVPTREAWDLVHKKANGLIFSRNIPDLFFSPLAEKIERYKKDDVSPWNEKFAV